MFTPKQITQIDYNYLLKFIALLALATGVPFLGIHSQWIVGPIVNATLILAVFLVGVRGAVLIGLLPSTIALSTGLLPAVLAPVIPFIIISNTLLVLVIDYAKKYMAYFPVLFIAASAKYLFLFITSSFIIQGLLNSALASKVAIMMSWPQFATAVIGGLMAWGVLKAINQQLTING